MHLLRPFLWRVLALLISAPLTLLAQAQTQAQAQAPTERAAASAAIQDYLEGTSFNRVEQIRRAFSPTARLYLTGRDGGMREIGIEDYLAGFRRDEGRFNGRVGHLQALQLEGDIATAKAEILVEQRKARFVDLFLLRKIEGRWRIISKTAVSETAPAHGRRVLLVLSSAALMPGSTLSAGNSFSELSRAYASLRAAGYSVQAVSPEGGAVPLAYVDASDPVQRAQLYDPDFMHLLAQTLRPEQVRAQDYAAVFFIGGSAAMFGVAENEGIQKLTMAIYEQHQGVVAAVCHGSAGLVNLRMADGSPLVAGRRVTGYPDMFENRSAPYYKTFPFSIEQRLKEGGGRFEHGARGQPHVVVDGRLVSGMNWESTRGVAEALVRAVEARLAP